MSLDAYIVCVVSAGFYVGKTSNPRHGEPFMQGVLENPVALVPVHVNGHSL
jgi:hypothetical protein